MTEQLTTAVVIITHNRPDYLNEALQGVANQTLAPNEIIVIDDCSTADYVPVLTRFSSLNITYQKLNTPSGANKARNEGIVRSTKDIVLLLDDDDIWMENYIEDHVRHYQEGADAIVSGHQRLNSEVIKINSLGQVSESSLREGNLFCGMSGFSAKRQVLISYPLDEQLGNAQDWDLYVRICCANLKFVNIPKPLFFYRMGTPDGITSKARKMSINDIEKRLGAAHKHRAWLGEKYYKKRIAEQVLSYLPNKKNKLSWVMKSIQLIGVTATLKSLLSKVFKKRSDV